MSVANRPMRSVGSRYSDATGDWLDPGDSPSPVEGCALMKLITASTSFGATKVSAITSTKGGGALSPDGDGNGPDPVELIMLMIARASLDETLLSALTSTAFCGLCQGKASSRGKVTRNTWSSLRA